MGDDAGMAGCHALVKQLQVAVERDAGDGVCREPAAANLGVVECGAG